ncbi:phytoene desaturase family protein [Candidatus Laterigemmans baculatus]|uniref:phytoene desaturase family protein n=1 Tax=Candidatus Laterigemmans baculatus TaxID=2770505 RepID=UPI001F350B5D|nr:NAD(P)/FAD-dependent oxidoreductase [Candidatus Laterigemmans baculatus]
MASPHSTNDRPIPGPPAPSRRYDAVVVGSGPNGLAAAVTLAQAGRSVMVIEASDAIGGGTRSAELTLPGFVHDICSAIHPLGVASPFFRSLPLEQHGLEWIQPEVPLAHPLPDGSAAAVYRSLEETAAGFGSDGESYRRLLKPLLAAADGILSQVLTPVQLPRHPLALARFGLRGMQSAERLAKRWFAEPKVQGMFAGMAAHAVLPLDQRFTAAVGLMFSLTAHHGGWPLPRGGSGRISEALQSYLRQLGGEVVTGNRVASLAELPPNRAVLFDLSPRQLARIAGDALPASYRQKLERFRHGPGVFKIDWALEGPIPWTAEACRRAGTVHVGGEFDAVAQAEAAAWSDQPAERPFLLVAQQSVLDPSRAPAGKHTGWGYCHVPHGSRVDMTEAIEAQMERFAPGFRDRILARHVMAPADFENYNANYIGGDITGGVMDLRQILARPTFGPTPYATPNPRLFLCSASTPPGPGVHGMSGYHAAQAALRAVLHD